MNIKAFVDNNQKDLVIKSRKHAIIFENNSDKDEYDIKFHFDKEKIKQIIEYISKECDYSWSNFKAKEATSLGSDYFEYYDRKLDNNGYLKILNDGLSFERPAKDNVKLYQLNKAKAQSFVYDLKRII